MSKSVTSIINSVHKNNISTFGDPRLIENYGYPLVPSIQLSAAYSFDNVEDLYAYHNNKYYGNRYCRDSNTGVQQLERYFEALFAGTKALMFNSGMAAMGTAIDSLIPANGVVYLTKESYRKTGTYIHRQAKKLNVSIKYFDSIAHLKNDMHSAKETLVILESPTNPHLYLHDFDALLAIKDEYQCKVIVDISLAGLCNIDFDFKKFDCTTFSCTKYISGHNDILGGVLLAGNEEVFNDLWSIRSERGGILESFSSYLLLRSLRTYDIRVAQQIENAKYVLDYLKKESRVQKIYHPEVANGTDAILFNKYYQHGGSMLSFVVDADLDKILSKLGQLNSIKMAPSFGAIDSLIEIPSVMSHYGKTPDELKAIGLEQNLIRLSIGCEPKNDLIDDINFLLDTSS